MRLSELRGPRWSDVDLEAGVIHVRQRADAWCRIGPPKSKAGKRDIPLAPIVVNALKQWQTECPKSRLYLVFATPRGNPISTWYAMQQPACLSPTLNGPQNAFRPSQGTPKST